MGLNKLYFRVFYWQNFQASLIFLNRATDNLVPHYMDRLSALLTKNRPDWIDKCSSLLGLLSNDTGKSFITLGQGQHLGEGVGRRRGGDHQGAKVLRRLHEGRAGTDGRGG
jgi:hypothetical protein